MTTNTHKNDNIIAKYFQVTDIWKRMCELHNELFELTSDEYRHLLSSEFEKIETITQEKQLLINEISKFDQVRQDVINKINQNGGNITKVNDILTYFSECLPEKEGKHLQRFNLLLIDIIERIQEQNKKNQLFINKAIHSLKEIREGVYGEEKLQLYNSKGTSRTVNTQRV